MKRTLFLGVIFLFLVGCTGMRSLAPVTPVAGQMEDISKKRCVKVGILADEYDDGMRELVKDAFAEMDRKYGIDAGAVTFIPVSFKGTKTATQVIKKMYEQIGPLGPNTADIFVVFSSRLMMEDVFALLTGGGFRLGYTEMSLLRYAFVRIRNTTLLVHELEHCFGARDGYYPDKNLQIILERKWRRFDGWYIVNHPDIPKEPDKDVCEQGCVWTPQEYVGVMERAKERGKSL